MFIRDLEYCQLEVSDNQFALVNGGGKKPPVKKPAPKLPVVAVTKVSLGALTQGDLLAVTKTDIDAITASGQKSGAFSSLEVGLSAVAVS